MELLASNANLASLIFVVWILSAILTIIFITIFDLGKRKETDSPVVPPGVAAWTVRKDSRWVKVYRLIWGAYPRDICSYFWKSLCILVAAIPASVFVFGSIMAAVFIIAILIIMVMLFLEFLLKVAVAIPSALASFAGALAEGGRFVGTSPTSHKIAGAVLLITFLVLFCRSRAGKVTRLRIKAWKNKHCPLIRVE